MITLCGVRDFTPIAHAETQRSYVKNFGRIAVFYDPSDQVTSDVAENLYRVLDLFYPSTEIITVSSFVELKEVLSEEFFVNIYVFRGDRKGLHVGEEIVPWISFGELLNEYKKTTPFGLMEHIVATGAAGLLLPYLESYEGFHVESSPVIDARLCYLYDLWTTAEILDKPDGPRNEEMLIAGQKLRQCALIYFSDNFNDLLNRVIEPVDKLGEELPGESLAERPEFQPSIVQEYPTPETPKSERPLLCIGSPSSGITSVEGVGAGKPHFGQDGDYIQISKLPLKSGVDGPVGKVIDAILEVLSDWLKDQDIPEWIGVSKNFSDEMTSYIKIFTKWLNKTVLDWLNEHLWETIGIGAATVGTALAIALSIDSVRAKLGELFTKLAMESDKYVSKILDKLNELLQEKLPLKYELKVPIGFGDFNLFKFKLKLELNPGFEMDSKAWLDFVNQTIFGEKDFEFIDLLDCIKIIPLFTGVIGIESFGTEKNGLVKYLFELLGLELKFSGEGGLKMALLKTTLSFGDVEFFEVREWWFKFSFELSRKFTIFDFFTAGCGGGVLAKAAEYVGLGHFYITVFFRVTLEIVRTFAAAGKNATSKLTLDITLGAVADLKILIVVLKGGLELTWRFIQDFLAETPLEIFLILYLWFEVRIDLWLVDFRVGKWEWWPFEEEGLRIAGGKGTTEYQQNALGLDTDEDGLSDDFENRIPGLQFNSPDSDSDGLTDKFELDVSKTMPDNHDTDGDGLWDRPEVITHLTDPLRRDTDWDNLTDYQEVITYMTSPLLYDTDFDDLSDYYEISTTYDFNVTVGLRSTPTVTSVIIGGEVFYNHTDPLNPDTDGDGLLDGQEGIRIGTYYGDPKFINATEVPVLFNDGYTHPLDYDTDDDSYEQYADGTVTERLQFFRDMSDGIEVRGQLVTFVNTTTGEPYEKWIHTNPCNPDTDDDSGGSPIINSDGRELSLTPPTDPTDGDTDDDGLIDGLEGTGGPDSYHTNPTNPDTDADGLNDGFEVQSDIDPLNPDTDGDQVSDGDEVLRFFTDPLLNDTDGDLLLDGEELFFFYSDPMVRDSDNDTLTDGFEAHIYGTDPVNPDSDGDGLDDATEVLFLRTDPLDPDTDADGISDWDEINLYNTNPNDWDSDYDSITEPDETGQMTLPCGDYEEVFIYHTKPLLADSDKDGLTDAQELYLAEGSPAFELMPLNPLNNDTDADGLTDGVELKIKAITTFLYPYSAQILISPYNSSAVLADTDSDGLLDGEEVLTYRCDPSLNDTDGDALADWDEVHIYFTDPANNDTDGDDLADNVEIFGTTTLKLGWGQGPGTQVQLAAGQTSANNSDTDGDMLPDALELQYGTDPQDPDTDGDGIQDGDEFDQDNDGLTDREEFYVYMTNHAVTRSSTPHPGSINVTSLEGTPTYLILGGFDNPDSDTDGLTDGDEVDVYGTNCTLRDTDGDGFSDGDEVTWGTDPLRWTAASEIRIPSMFAWNVTIHVIDAQSLEDIPSASVYLTNSIWTSPTKTTNSTGFAGFYNVTEGTYTVVTSAQGYVTNYTTINLNQTQIITLKLSREPPPPLIPSIYGIVLLVGIGVGVGALTGVGVTMLIKKHKGLVEEKVKKPKKTEGKAGG